MVSIDSGTPTLWNIHYLNLDLCPSFKLSEDPEAFRGARESWQVIPGFPHDTFLNVKDSLHILFCSADRSDPVQE